MATVHLPASHAGSPRLPWHIASSSQLGALLYVVASQSMTVLQQSPSLQQTPLLQCPLSHSLSAMHALPSGPSATQDPLAQCALSSQSVSSAHDALQLGCFCSFIPAQKT